MWQFVEVAPQPFGECTVCKRHVCGDYTDEHGVKRQKWAHLPIELDKGGNLVIGYQCIKSMSDDAGITVRVVEKVVHNEPSDEQLLRVMRGALGGADWGEFNHVPSVVSDEQLFMNKMTELTSLSHSKLKQRAKEAGVQGWSTKSPDELIAALMEAQQ